MARIALTGAAGFVGRHLVPLLQSEGYEIRSLVRVGSRPALVGTEVIHGDLRNAEIARTLVWDCETVIHLAAGFWPGEDGAETITAGTQYLVEAARGAGVARIIFMSCQGAQASAHSPYFAAKWRAEMTVRGAEIPFVILRPSVILGRGDGVLEPLAGLIRTYPAVPVPGRGEFRTQPVDVEDVARCIVLAAAGAQTGETVSLGGSTYVTFRQLVDLIAGQMNLLRPKLLVPPPLMSALVRLLPPASRTLYLQPRLGQFENGVVTSPGIIERAFGFQPVPIVSRIHEYLEGRQ